ncbi:phosphoglycerate mutase [Diplocarpon rosae]|nr:phosphoglycerate mutase [Diplocarpon rosae]
MYVGKHPTPRPDIFGSLSIPVNKTDPDTKQPYPLPLLLRSLRYVPYASDVSFSEDNQVSFGANLDQAKNCSTGDINSGFAPGLLQRKVTIHLLRHAQILDPGLTNYGIAQSSLLRSRFEPMDRVTHILSSPLHRTLHTALIAFKPIIEKGLQIVALPELREYGNCPASTGSEMGTVIRELYNEEHVTRDCIDGTLVPDGWEINHEGESPEEMLEIRQKRVKKVLESLYLLGLEATKSKGGLWEGHAVSQGKDVDIVVSTHSALIMDLYKSYEFPTENMVKTGVPYYKLIETEESKGRIHTFP